MTKDEQSLFRTSRLTIQMEELKSQWFYIILLNEINFP